MILKRGYGNSSYGRILSTIAIKVFTHRFSSLPLIDQHTLLIFSDEFERKYASAVDETMRDEAKDLLWTLGPSSFFDAVVHKVDWYKDRKVSENVATFNHNEKIDILGAGCQAQLFLNLYVSIDLFNDDYLTVNTNAYM